MWQGGLHGIDFWRVRGAFEVSIEPPDRQTPVLGVSFEDQVESYASELPGRCAYSQGNARHGFIHP